MKNKYQRLSKAEKKQVKEDFKHSRRGFIYPKFRRVLLLCVIGMIYSIGCFVYDFIEKANTWSFVLDGLLLVFCVAVFFKVCSLFERELNNYLINKK